MTGRISLGLIATAAILVLLANVAGAADSLRVVCFVSAQPSQKLERGYALGVRLLVTDSKPVSGATVRIYEVVDLFGTKEMLIGTAATDSQGQASLDYLPARTGSHEIIARFAGMPGYAATEGRTTFQAEIAAEPYVVAPPPLASFTSKVPYVVGAVVLAVWGLIAYALIGTARGVTSGARKNKLKGDIA